MNKLTIMIAIVAAAAAACGKKTPTASDATATTPTPTAPAAGGAGGAAGAKADAGAPPAAPTAAGGEVAALTAATDCPKSLSGPEEVARTIKKECGPITVTGEYYVNGSLTLEAGVILKMAEGSSIVVGYDKPAKIIVKGTAAEPVTMTAAGDPVAGFWKGLHLYPHSSRSQIDGLVVEHVGNERGAIYVAGKDVVLKNSTIRDAKEVGLRIENEGSLTQLSGLTFEKAGRLAASVPASVLGSTGANKLDEGSLIEVRGGRVDENAKWQNAGAPYLFTEEVSIAGKTGKVTVEIAAGTELRFADNVELAVGYDAAGGLTTAGTADKPVVFTSGGEKAAGTWKGIHVYGNGDLKLEGAVVEHAGKEENRGAVWADTGAQITVKGTTVRTNTVGLDLLQDAKVREIDGNTFSGNTVAAVRLFAGHLGKLGPGNKLEKEPVTVRGGPVKENATWNAFGAVTEITEDVGVTGRSTLTLAPGLDLAFRSGVELGVGYDEIGGLKAAGAADKPIRLHGVTDDAGSWEGVVLYGQARDVVIEHVVIEGSGGEGGIKVRDDAVAKISSVTCRKCAEAAVFVNCRGKAELSEIKAEDGTPAADKKAEGCN